MTSQETTANRAEEHRSATAEDALRLVRDFAGDGAQVSAFVDTWVRHGNATAVAAVAESGAGPARKAARRGLAVLRSRGVSAPTQTHVARLAEEPAVVTEQAYLLAPDSSGSVLLSFSRRVGSGRAASTFVVLNDSVGVIRIDNDELPQSKFLERIERALPNASYGPVPVPVPWARWRVSKALATLAARGLPPPLGLMTARPQLEPAPTEPVEHPLDAEGLVLGPEDAAERARGSGRLHELPELRGWLPPRQSVDALLLEVGKTLTPNQEPAEGQVERELERQVRAATDRYFSPQVREQLVVLLKDATLSVLAREGEQVALDLVATMDAISRAGLITEPPHEIPFLRGFFDKAIGILLAQNSGQLRIPIPNRPADASPEGTDEDTATSTGEPARADAADEGAAEATDTASATERSDDPEAAR